MKSLLSEYGREYGYAAVLGVVLILNATGTFTNLFGVDTAIIVTLLAGYKTFYNSISALLAKTISADIALCIAVIAALSVGQNLAAAEAMFIVMVGETLESFAAGRTEAAIRRFIAQLPRLAHLLRDGTEVEVDAGTLSPDDQILVRAGERISADGVIEEGLSSIDESSITGEPLPKDKQPGDDVFSGTLNGNGLLRIRVTRAGSDTTLARVIRLVEEAREKRAPVERLADHYARYFLPALLLAGVLTFYFTRDWLRTVAVLIVACPCALILATPTAMVAAMGGLARRGILVRGGSVLQLLSKVDTVVFDKTGTVTEGRFEIVRIVSTNGGENELLAMAAASERASDHALARVIVAEAERRHLAVPESREAIVVPGRGVECTLGGRRWRAGNAAYLAEHGVQNLEFLRDEADRRGATAVFLADEDRLAGAIMLRDRLRDGVVEATDQLKKLGIANLVMLTGDRKRPADVIAREIGISAVEAELLPEEKLDRIRQLATRGQTVAMLGDGINDAPSLAAASVGIAVAGASDITAEAADVVYLPHSLDKLPRLFEVSQRAMQTAWLNIVLFAGVLNLLAVTACATGRLGPIGAALTHQLSSFCVMMNSLRLLRVEREAGSGRFARLFAQFNDWRSKVRIENPSGWLAEHRAQLARMALAGAFLFTILNGFYAIQPDELGIVERFGRKVMPFSAPGLHYKWPWPVELLTRIKARRVRVVEIGFRSNGRASGQEPSSYEWNVQHRGGRFESRPEESLLLTGDQNMIELNATVHYDITRPDLFLFRQLDGDLTVRSAAESVIHGIAGTRPLDSVLTIGRRAIEQQAQAELQRRMDRYEAGVRVLRFKLEDVHPSIDVVGAFRGVSAAFEEKSQMINEAEGYRNEQVALSRGRAKAEVQNANSYTVGRTNRAGGDAIRFAQHEQAFRAAPGPTETRLYLEALEQVLPGRRKMIVDSGKGMRRLVLLEDGVEIAPPGTPILGRD